MPGMTYIETEHPRTSTGQWTEKEHSAPEVQLGGDITRAEAEEMVAKVGEFARYYTRRYNMDESTREEIVQDTILDVLGQQRRGAEHVLSHKFLNHATRAVASRYIDPNVHHTALTGRARLNARVDEEMQRLGRSLLPGEYDRLADEIRMSFPPGRRPSPGYQYREYVASLDKAVGEDGDTTLGELIPAAEAPEDSFATAATPAAAAVDALEEGSISAAEARKAAWVLVAQDAPEPRAAAMKDDRPTRAYVAAAGGAAELARKWEQGLTTEEDDRHLFAPFGDIDADARERVVSVLVRRRDYADDLWGAAVDAAVDHDARDAIRRAEKAAARRAARQRAREVAAG